MRVLYLITRAERGGGQVHVLDLLRGYAPSHECHLATGEDGFLCDMADRQGVPVHHISNLIQPIHPFKDLCALVNTVRLIRLLRPDIIHAHTSKAGFIGRMAGALTSTPVVYTVHMWSFTEGISRWRRAICVPVERLCARLSAKTITVSEANRRLGIEAGVGDLSTLTTIWNGVPDTPWRSSPWRETPVRIVMVARFAPPKSYALLLQALSGISSDFQLLCIGSGPDLAQARELTASLNLEAKVQFLLDRDDVAEILATAQIFVLSSRWEGLPLSILEAMRAGLPVVASDVGGVSEAVLDGETGMLVSPDREEDLRMAIQKLIDDPLLRARLGAAGRRRYEAEFSWDVMLSKTQLVYSEVVTQPFFKDPLQSRVA